MYILINAFQVCKNDNSSHSPCGHIANTTSTYLLFRWQMLTAFVSDLCVNFRKQVQRHSFQFVVYFLCKQRVIFLMMSSVSSTGIQLKRVKLTRRSSSFIDLDLVWTLFSVSVTGMSYVSGITLIQLQK